MANLPLTAFDVAVLVVVGGLGADLADARGDPRGAHASRAGSAPAWSPGTASATARELARQTIETAWLADAAAFGVAFVVPLIGFKIVAAMLADRMPGGSIGLVDRVAGLAFGAARGAVIVSAAYLGLTMAIAPEEQPAWVREALVLPYVRGRCRHAATPDAGRARRAQRGRRRGAPPRRAQLGRSARQLATAMSGRRCKLCADRCDLRPDKLREECGVFGIFGNDEAAAHTVLGLHALQHRGQEAAGVVTFDGRLFHNHRALGLVGDHFSSEAVISGLPGHAAIGHVRYSTQGAPLAAATSSRCSPTSPSAAWRSPTTATSPTR